MLQLGKSKYKVQQEFANGDLVYCGYRYILGIFPEYIPGTLTRHSELKCISIIKDYHYSLRKPHKRILYLER